MDPLAGLYTDLEFHALDDEVFTDLVIARIVEPTTLLDNAQVLTDLGGQERDEIGLDALGKSRHLWAKAPPERTWLTPRSPSRDRDAPASALGVRSQTGYEVGANPMSSRRRLSPASPPTDSSQQPE